MKVIKPHEIKTGYTLLVDSKGFLPDAIDWFQGNRFNHAGFFYRSVSGKLFVSEAVNTGVGFNVFDNEYYKKYLNHEIDLLCLVPKFSFFKTKNYEELTDFLLDHTTDRYEYENLLIWQPVKYIAKKIFNREIWIGKTKPDAYICGQWVAKIYRYMTGQFSDWVKVAPVDLYNSGLFELCEIDIEK